MVYELGTVGMVCPFPLIEAQKKMTELDLGDELKLILIVHRQLRQSLIGRQKMVTLLLIMNNSVMHLGQLLFKKRKVLINIDRASYIGCSFSFQRTRK